MSMVLHYHTNVVANLHHANDNYIVYIVKVSHGLFLVLTRFAMISNFNKTVLKLIIIITIIIVIIIIIIIIIIT